VLSAREKHTRECYVVAKEGADLARIEKEIKEMPNYFADYDTTVTFITMEEMKEKHMALPHGGRVIRTGRTGLTGANSHTVEFSLALDSNPEFTSSVLVAYARAAYRLAEKGEVGCKTVLDVPPALLSPMTYEELLSHLL
jgi:diaminopimelate dehydrogenase